MASNMHIRATMVFPLPTSPCKSRFIGFSVSISFLISLKSLEENFQSIEGIAGGTILGDGNVALIVDVQGLRAPPLHKNAA